MHIDTFPIVCSFSEHRGRSCIVSHAHVGRLGSRAYNSFRWRAISKPEFNTFESGNGTKLNGAHRVMICQLDAYEPPEVRIRLHVG